MVNGMHYPENKKFAFTILDDTDASTLDNVKPIYEFLQDLGLFTTKTVWVFPTTDKNNPDYDAHTLQNRKYLEFIKWLHGNGVEIALHNASMESSGRQRTLAALEQFHQYLDFFPNIHINHDINAENLYWGYERLDLPFLRLLMKIKKTSFSSFGHIPDSDFFWGDLCQQHITYVRNLVFREINLLTINPTLPYRDPRRPYVPYWFSSSEGGTVDAFNKLLSIKNQDRLEKERGVCIVYTHFGKGFVEQGKIHPTTKKLLIEMAKRDGLFIPVSPLLDYLRTQHLTATRSFFERVYMELNWFVSKAIFGTS